VAASGWDIVIKQVTDLGAFDRAVKVGVQTVLATQKKRIFVEGEDAGNNKIGTYSTKPISISKKNQSRNTGKTYFKGGYAEYKTAVGKNDGFVNLRNTDQMNFDYQFFDLGNNTYGLGFSNEFNFQKSGWLEKKYDKKIFEQSQREGQLLNSVIEYEISKDLR
jgi:hypothetical protein